MAQVDVQPVTIDMLTVFDEDKRVEVSHGYLVENDMTAGYNHAIVMDAVYHILSTYVIQHKLGRVYPDGLTYILHQEEDIVIASRIPDVSFIKKGRVTKDMEKSRPLALAPDLAVEIISPTETTAILAQKVSDFLQYGTQEVWALYPLKHELHRYRRDDNTPQIYKPDEIFAPTELFSELSVKVNLLFRDRYAE